IVSGRFLPRLPACFCANRPNSTNLVLVGSRVRPNFPNRRRKASCTPSVCWSRKSWSTMTPSRSGTRSRPKHQHRPPAARRYPQTANSGSAMKVTFCVRGVLSPLLANIYMRRFVLGWKKLGLERSLGTRLVTYADDLVILCRKGNAEEALHHLGEIMGKLKLTVNEEKTRICSVPA